MFCTYLRCVDCCNWWSHLKLKANPRSTSGEPTKTNDNISKRKCILFQNDQWSQSLHHPTSISQNTAKCHFSVNNNFSISTMKLQAATHVLLLVSLSVLPSCASREFLHSSDNHGTNWYTNILMRDTKAVSLPANQFPNDAISAGYCMGCTTWPSPSSSMALALAMPINEPVEQQLNLELPLISSKAHASKLHRLIKSQHEKKPTPASYEETCYRQQIILTLVLLGVAAFAFSSKHSKETNDTNYFLCLRSSTW